MSRAARATATAPCCRTGRLALRPTPPAAPLAGALTAVVLAAGCSAAGSAPSAAPPGAPSPATSSAPPAPVSDVPQVTAEPDPTPARADLALTEAASRYLAARENAISYKHRTPRSWLSEVRPVMTRAGWQRLADSAGDSGGYPAATARANKWSVRVTVACHHNPDAGPPTATRATLTCSLTDRTTNGGGIAIPVKDLPAIWPYDGPQPPALLEMHQTGGRWLVDADRTGQAG